MTIFAARRVLPPDLITPAKASKPFMKETGPDAIPPPESCSLEERMGERLLPVPEPHLKSIPSVLASSRIALIDQLFGTSTFFCSKMTSPDSLVMAAVQYSHSTVS